jgi:hypothetical protein
MKKRSAIFAVVDGNESAEVEDLRRERLESTWPDWPAVRWRVPVFI